MSTPVAYSRIERKVYEYKVFDSSGTYITSWQDVVSEFSYNQEMNSAGSAIDVVLARNTDTGTQSTSTRITQASDTRITEDSTSRVAITDSGFDVGTGSDIELNNNVEVYVHYGYKATRITQASDTRVTESGDVRVSDVGAVNGRLIFTGYISKYVSQYGSSEQTKVTVLSHGAELGNYLLESGSTTTITYSSQDPANILKDVLDKFTAAGGLVDYNATSVTPTGSVVSYVFKVNTVLEAVKKCLELSPTDWYFYVDMANNILYLRPRPTVTSHKFVLGKHIESLQLSRSLEGLVNKIYFSGGDIGGGVNLFKKYTDTTSISAWRPGLKKISDTRVTVEASATLIAESEINRYKDPRYTSEITILDSAYNIEDIQVGQLVGFANFGNFIDALTMQIVSLTYSPDRVRLQLDTLLPEVSKRVEDLKRNLDSLNVLDNPSAPT